jgi:hypothetical protein
MSLMTLLRPAAGRLLKRLKPVVHEETSRLLTNRLSKSNSRPRASRISVFASCLGVFVRALLP